MMGLFDLFKNKNDKKKKIEAQEPPKQTPIDRRSIPDDAIDRAQKIWASKDYCEKVYRLYYRDYPEKPFISTDRELYTNWLEQAEQFPRTSIVERKMMVRDTLGLLPGHYYMLYWIKSIHRKLIPSYFEYDYGICFQEEKIHLQEKGYLDIVGKVTEKGIVAINEHIDIIRQRTPEPKIIKAIDAGAIIFNDYNRDFTDLPLGKLVIPQKDFSLLLNEIEEIKKAVSLAKRLSGIRYTLDIGFKDIDFERSYYMYTPMSGAREAKYPLALQFYSRSYALWAKSGVGSDVYFGTVKYLQNGIIGDARIIFWKKADGIQINVRTKKGETYIHDVQTVNASKDMGRWKFAYKAK